MAMAVACHRSILAIDHLGEIIKMYGNGSVVGNIKLHRTKSSGLIRHVIAPSLKNDLTLDFAGKK